MFLRNEVRLPHSLRLPILILRIVIGLSFFYVGFSVLFDPSLIPDLKGRLLGGLLEWLASPSPYSWLPPLAQWLFLGVGICLVIGFATRLASLIGGALTVWSFLPDILSARLNLIQFLSDEVVIAICLVVIFFSKAGHYAGFDKFLHFSLRHKK